MARSNRRVWLMLLSLGALLGAIGGVNWLIDPYGAWGTSFLDRIYLKNEDPRVFVPYRLRRVEPTTLLVGASRVFVGMPVELGYHDGVLNAALLGSSVEELSLMVERALENRRLKRLVWGVEFVPFDERWATLRDNRLPLRLERNAWLMLTETLLSADALLSSVRVGLRRIGGPGRLPPTRLIPQPWPASAIQQALEEYRNAPPYPVNEPHLAGWVRTYGGYRFSGARFGRFERTVADAKEAGIEVTLVLLPLSEYELELIRQTGKWESFQRWRRDLVRVAPYWDFSGYNHLARADHLFMDPWHVRPGVGEAILRLLMGEDCATCGAVAREIIRAGVWVDASTVDAHLASQDAAMRRRMQEESRYSRLVRQLIETSRLWPAGQGGG